MKKRAAASSGIMIIAAIWCMGLLSCAMDIPEKSSEFLAPPYISAAYQDGPYIKVDFYGYNDEYYFDGYNAYVSTTQIVPDFVPGMKYVHIADPGYASAEPSFPLSPDDYDPSKKRTISLYHYWIITENRFDLFPFAPCNTYSICLASHHRLGSVMTSSVSNSISVDFK